MSLTFCVYFLLYNFKLNIYRNLNYLEIKTALSSREDCLKLFNEEVRNERGLGTGCGLKSQDPVVHKMTCAIKLFYVNACVSKLSIFS